MRISLTNLPNAGILLKQKKLTPTDFLVVGANIHPEIRKKKGDMQAPSYQSVQDRETKDFEVLSLYLTWCLDQLSEQKEPRMRSFYKYDILPLKKNLISIARDLELRPVDTATQTMESALRSPNDDEVAEESGNSGNQDSDLAQSDQELSRDTATHVENTAHGSCIANRTPIAINRLSVDHGALALELNRIRNQIPYCFPNTQVPIVEFGNVRRTLRASHGDCASCFQYHDDNMLYIEDIIESLGLVRQISNKLACAHTMTTPKRSFVPKSRRLPHRNLTMKRVIVYVIRCFSQW